MSTRKELTGPQKWMLACAAAPMAAVGIAGGFGTYSNVIAEFGRAATAIGVVAAGEGLTLVLALTMLALTLLGQATPRVVRAGLWLAPAAAALVGVAVADGLTEQIVYAATPLAMCGAAEGLGLIARRIVIYTTGVDAEARRRTATAVQRLAYQRAVADRHPDEGRREDALRKSWRLAEQIGVDDPELAAGLIEDQRKRLRQGADEALAGMLTAAPEPARPEPVPVRTETAEEILARKLAAMSQDDAVRLAADAHPDAHPAELAAILGHYGITVDAVQVALILARQPEQHDVYRPDTADAPKVSGLHPVTVEAAVVEAASALGPDAKAREIAEHLARHRRLVVTEPYIRTALSREAKRQQGTAPATPMEGGYA
ncbi:hypothetical protein GPA10_24910 [Streptomyces sp. p1417]|uniref:Conjugal transfer protein n=1 Tax=Streptomyces typhae TaxID=2681492 RepID=A0A6L6X2Q7_9ACTN|nr:hypothetical protein [Streptomyces typhae]MVO87909.1 hypothetical protein [Streptomyces typhae]